MKLRDRKTKLMAETESPVQFDKSYMIQDGVIVPRVIGYVASSGFRIGHGPVACDERVINAPGSHTRWLVIDMSRDRLWTTYVQRGYYDAATYKQVRVARRL